MAWLESHLHFSIRTHSSSNKQVSLVWHMIRSTWLTLNFVFCTAQRHTWNCLGWVRRSHLERTHAFTFDLSKHETFYIYIRHSLCPRAVFEVAVPSSTLWSGQLHVYSMPLIQSMAERACECASCTYLHFCLVFPRSAAF